MARTGGIPQFAQAQPGIAPLPTVESLRRNAHLAAYLGDGFARLNLPQRIHNLLFALPFRGIGSPSTLHQRTTSRPKPQLSLCLVFGFWVRVRFVKAPAGVRDRCPTIACLLYTSPSPRD